MEKLVHKSNQFLDKLNVIREYNIQNFKRRLEDELYNFSCRIKTLRKR